MVERFAILGRSCKLMIKIQLKLPYKINSSVGYTVTTNGAEAPLKNPIKEIYRLKIWSQGIACPALKDSLTKTAPPFSMLKR